MKIAVYQCYDEVTLKFCEIKDGYYPQFPNHKFIGLLGNDFVIEKPKKLVTKEAQEINYKLCAVYNSKAFTIPVNAKNIRCTYEVEE